MKVKQIRSLRVVHVLNKKGGNSVNKPTRVYFAASKKEKDFAFVLQDEGVKAFASHLPAYNHKEAWSLKLPFIEIFNKCKLHGVKEIRVYVADEGIFEKVAQITNNLNRIASENGISKLEVFFLKDGDYPAEYQAAEYLIKQLGEQGVGEINVEVGAVDDFEFEVKHAREYQPKFMAKKPLYVGKNHAQHGREKTRALKTNNTQNERNFKNVMLELLENNASVKAKAKEAIKYVNEVLFRDGLGFVALDQSTLQEWTMDWVETMKMSQKDKISVTHLEDFLLSKVEFAISFIDRKKHHTNSHLISNTNRPPLAAIA